MDNRPIGVFDSGLGGLTVVKELKKCLPGESIVYFGDTARLPYGTRSKDIVNKYSDQCVRFLLEKNIKMVIVACNTASSTSLETLRKSYDIPILGVINPGARAAIKATQNGRIGVIGTAGTIRSRAYPQAMKGIDSNVTVYDQACSLFVPIVEEGWSNTEVARLTALKYLQDIKDKGIDTLVLACTHYPLLSDTISKVMAPHVRLINPGEGTALSVVDLLREKDMAREDKTPSQSNFYVSDFGERFQMLGSHFLNMEIDAEKIDIESY
ncbi:MAG TPA: glutamate racemase [Bacillota bacterium]|nr:glutamate racemase [Bacillota bacterium]